MVLAWFVLAVLGLELCLFLSLGGFYQVLAILGLEFSTFLRRCCLAIEALCLVGFVFVVLYVLNAIEVFRHCWPFGPPNEGGGPGCELVLWFGLDLARLAISSMLLRF